jgi:hypothetical protein
MSYGQWSLSGCIYTGVQRSHGSAGYSYSFPRMRCHIGTVVMGTFQQNSVGQMGVKNYGQNLNEYIQSQNTRAFCNYCFILPLHCLEFSNEPRFIHMANFSFCLNRVTCLRNVQPKEALEI